MPFRQTILQFIHSSVSVNHDTHLILSAGFSGLVVTYSCSVRHWDQIPQCAVVLITSANTILAGTPTAVPMSIRHLLLSLC